MKPFSVRRHALGMLSIAIMFSVGAQAQSADPTSSCESFDVDRNGLIELADEAPLLRDASLMASCGSISLVEATRCESFDANGDGLVYPSDFASVRAVFDLYADCYGRRADLHPGCTTVDGNSDGLVDHRDLSGVLGEIARFEGCIGVDLDVLRCRGLDADGDGRISTSEQAALTDRLDYFESCLGLDVSASTGIWISHARLMSLPTNGSAWDRILAEASAPYLTPNLSDQNDPANTRVLAKALVGQRLSRGDLLSDVERALRSVTYVRSETNADALAVGRELAAYIIAADVIELALRDPDLDLDFRDRLRELRAIDLSGRTLISTHEERPNNWGTHAGATRVAIALYLGDDDDLAQAVEVFQAWLGESTADASFRFGSLSWQADQARPVGINPRGAHRNGIDLDGAQPEEMRRGGSLQAPPRQTGYPWEALQGATVTAELLARNGYPDAWSWGDDALYRAVDYLGRLDVAYGGWWAEGDDRWLVWLVNQGTDARFPTEVGVSVGKNLGFTDWTHADCAPGCP